MATDWKWRLYLFVRASDVTAAHKQAVAEALANNGSGEAVEDEAAMYLGTVRLSTSGNPPAQAFGINVPVKASMRDAIRAILDALPQARYAVVANTQLAQHAEAELIATTFNVTPSGQIVQWADALAFLATEFGLQPIGEAA